MMKLAFIGFGNVGYGLLEILYQEKKDLKDSYGFDFEVLAITDPKRDSVYQENGLDLRAFFNGFKRTKQVSTSYDSHKKINSKFVIQETDANVIIETTPSNYNSGEPGLHHIRLALECGKHVVTTNKAPIALAYKELSALAHQKSLRLLFEGTVMAGTPIFNLHSKSLP
jgi:homoserine dehydrogenase